MLQDAGNQVRVLNASRGASASSEHLSYRTTIELMRLLLSHAVQGWLFHVHTNGHNRKSWLLILLCGLASRLGPGSVLTLHSGMTPAYLSAGRLRRAMARLSCALFDRIICVSSEIQQSLVAIGVSASKSNVLPAYLPSLTARNLPDKLEAFFTDHTPVLATVLFFRPEYGFEFLLQGLERLRRQFPRAGCLVIGGGENAIEARLALLKSECAESVLLLGDLPHDLCLALISRSQLFVRCTTSDGDAISVREALASGVPVVASDTGHRPRGTLLFPVGDLESFVRIAAQALGEESGSEPEGEQPAGGSRNLLAIYQGLATEEAR